MALVREPSDIIIPLRTLLGDLSYLLRPQHGDARQKAVIHVVVGHDDVALLLLRQHKLHIILYVGSCFNESSINVTGYEIEILKRCCSSRTTLVISSFVFFF